MANSSRTPDNRPTDSRIDPVSPVPPLGADPVATRTAATTGMTTDNRTVVRSGSGNGLLIAAVLLVLAVIAYFVFAPGDDNVAVENTTTVTEEPAGEAAPDPGGTGTTAPATDAAPDAAPATDGAAPATDGAAPATDGAAPAIEGAAPAAPATDAAEPAPAPAPEPAPAPAPAPTSAPAPAPAQ